MNNHSFAKTIKIEGQSATISSTANIPTASANATAKEADAYSLCPICETHTFLGRILTTNGENQCLDGNKICADCLNKLRDFMGITL